LRNAQNAKVRVANTAAINRPGKLFMESKVGRLKARAFVRARPVS
jgi:hypothetical protein